MNRAHIAARGLLGATITLGVLITAVAVERAARAPSSTLALLAAAAIARELIQVERDESSFARGSRRGSLRYVLGNRLVLLLVCSFAAATLATGSLTRTSRASAGRRSGSARAVTDSPRGSCRRTRRGRAAVGARADGRDRRPLDRRRPRRHGSALRAPLARAAACPRHCS